MANRILDFDLIKHCTVIQLHKESVSDRSFGRVVVFNAEAFFFDAINFGTQGIDARIRSGFVSANWRVTSYERKRERWTY
jgi:hypothetical protein